MASVYDIKPKFQSLLRPIVIKLAKRNITANQVTISALLLSLITGALICFFPNESWTLLLIPAVLFVRMALNAADGMLAREHDMKTKLGAVLNELGDVISDTVLYLPLVYVSGFVPELIVVIVILSIISEMSGVIGIQISGKRRYEGPMGKSDRAFIFGLASLLLGIGVGARIWLISLQYIIIFLLIVTIINRTKKSLEDERVNKHK